jgi:pimeloyl-ACP methyl ester carboxylesterase
MEIRRSGACVPAEPEALRRAFPDATSRIVLFVHGLCETDAAWRIAARGADRSDRRTYGERLQDELSFTPVYLRYNTGLHVSENGRALATLLEALVRSWPVSVEELVLVGHSMGGLVARSACHYGEQDGLSFTDAIRHVFCLGTPHLGADLEKGANVLSWALSRLPETRAMANLINTRSVGIKDLRFGSCVEEDWCDCDPDEYLRDRCHEVPFLPDARYYFIGSNLYRGRFGTLLGDLLVRMPSASGRGNGRGRRIPFEVDNGHELSGLNHFDLLNHPAVYEQLRAWITRVPGRVLPSAA